MISLFELYLLYLDRRDKKKEQRSPAPAPIVIHEPTLDEVAKYGRRHHFEIDPNGLAVQKTTWVDAVSMAIVRSFAPLFPKLPISTFWIIFAAVCLSLMTYSLSILQR